MPKMLTPLVQDGPIDVDGWKPDEQFAVFPQGARAKNAMFAPEPPPQVVLKSGKRYLFKLSRRAYPDQFWAEVVAYRVGCMLDVPVPPAFAGWNSSSGQCGALIEWFYDVGTEAFVLAGDFLHQLRPDFDRARGTTHNMADNIKLLRALGHVTSLRGDSRTWWTRALTFDALIGNTDRHQDNWGLVIDVREVADLNGRQSWLAPCFDNGTSLGMELQTERAAKWDVNRLRRYAERGRHHVCWALDDPTRCNGHLHLLLRALAEWPEERPRLQELLQKISTEDFARLLSDLTQIDVPVRFTQDRFALIVRLLAHRLSSLKESVL